MKNLSIFNEIIFTVYSDENGKIVKVGVDNINGYSQRDLYLQLNLIHKFLTKKLWSLMNDKRYKNRINFNFSMLQNDKSI